METSGLTELRDYRGNKGRQSIYKWMELPICGIRPLAALLRLTVFGSIGASGASASSREISDRQAEESDMGSQRRILFVGPGIGKDAKWPSRMCGGSGRLVEILSYPQVHGGRFSRLFWAYIGYILRLPRLLLRGHRYDGIVFIDAYESVMVAASAKLLGMNRPRIILFDLIAYKGGLYHKLVNAVIMFAASRIDAVSVTGKGLVDWYHKLFPGLRSIYYIPGAFATYAPAQQPSGEDGSIFSGGGSLRDWVTLLAAARQLPEQRFVIVGMASDPKLSSELVPPNLSLSFDLGMDEFYSLMDQASIVVLPILDKQTAAGLSVLGSALRRGKPTIVTRTIVTQDYVQHGDNGLLVAPGDVDGLVAQIRRLLGDSKLRARLSEGAIKWSQGPTQTEFFGRFNKMLDEVFDTNCDQIANRMNRG